MNGTELICHYCATLRPPEGAPHNPDMPASVTIHDQRGCRHVCWKHALWRSTTSNMGGHSHDCTWATHTGCVTRPSGTCMYLADGTKVIVRRDGSKVWIENVPQAVLRAR